MALPTPCTNLLYSILLTIPQAAIEIYPSGAYNRKCFVAARMHVPHRESMHATHA